MTNPRSRVALVPLAALTAALLCSGPARAAPAFSAAVERDAATGWNVILLRHEGKTPYDALEVRIAPEAGGNLFSLTKGGEELLVQPAKLGELAGNRAGTPILFPTPNRVRDAAFEWEGKRFTFAANNGKNFIHGLVRTRPFQFATPAATGRGAAARLYVDWDEKQPEWERFPIRHRLEVTYTLGRDGVRIAFAVENRDKGTLPFGFGLHPWFRIPAERKDVFLTVPAGARMVAEEKLPTGALERVAGTPYDLRQPVSLEKLDLDDVFFGLTPSARPAFEWRDRGLRLSFAGSREFTHMVVYTPAGKPFFCMENQTSSTDAHNLHAAGRKKEAHLLVARPGGTVRGHVDWKIERLRPAR